METGLYDLGKKYRTDKIEYGYMNIYSPLLERIRNNNINIFEIGICEGGSLKMWEEYFPNGSVYGMDLAEEGSMRISTGLINSLNKGRIKTHIGNQNKREDLKKAINKFGVEYDIIIDDGHHFQSPQQVSLGFLFPYLKPGGIYILEDIVTLWNLSQGSEWGQVDRKNFTDCTQKVLEDFLDKGVIKSPYMINEEMEYLNNNIEKISIYYPQQQRRGDGPLGPADLSSPITGRSALAVILKRG